MILEIADIGIPTGKQAEFVTAIVDRTSCRCRWLNVSPGWLNPIEI
jgi:hypothetical protein